MHAISVSKKALYSAPSNDSNVTVPNTDKTCWYISPYGRAAAWNMCISKIEKRCGGSGGGSGTTSGVGSVCGEDGKGFIAFNENYAA